MTDPRPAGERAADLRARILAVVEAGKFTLKSLEYLQRRPGGRCCGCALGAAAFALGARGPIDSPLPLERIIGDAGIASRGECFEMEAGFEAWDDRARHPEFYALGVELRSLAEKAAP